VELFKKLSNVGKEEVLFQLLPEEIFDKPLVNPDRPGKQLYVKPYQ